MVLSLIILKPGNYKAHKKDSEFCKLYKKSLCILSESNLQDFLHKIPSKLNVFWMVYDCFQLNKKHSWIRIGITCKKILLQKSIDFDMALK